MRPNTTVQQILGEPGPCHEIIWKGVIGSGREIEFVGLLTSSFHAVS